jgi:hypothetical protein
MHRFLQYCATSRRLAISRLLAGECKRVLVVGAVPVNISGGNNFSGLTYAPNAPVLISGTGNFSKAPPGWTSPMTGAGTALTANQNEGLSYQLGPNGSVIQGWQPVTWQESNPLASP